MASALESSNSAQVASQKPELLAPAGDRTCLVAAIENGADAVYFGVQGHNARARAANFEIDALPEVMDLLHRRGVRGYVTLNTLIFTRELDDVARLVGSVAAAGVDAVIVQDLGLARLIREICPDLEIHASTQMSITSGEGLRLAAELGCTRVILARELSLDEIRRTRSISPLPVEVFVHGALCVAYSGQCLTSEALGGRSANRGECAQACRMPYEIVCDGERVDLDSTKYLLSPQDLAAFDLVPNLMEIGVASLKIEGRLKTPEYVANITRHYRKAIDEAWAGREPEFSRREIQEMELSFSRGFSHGFLDGNDHKVLVRGDYAKKRGVLLGRVERVAGRRVRLEISAPIKRGDGVVFDGDEDAGVPEQGGRVFEVARVRGRSVDLVDDEVASGVVELGFGRDDIDLASIRPGARIWKTDDPELTRRLRKTFEGAPKRRVRLDVEVEAIAGRPLRILGRTALGTVAEVADDQALPVAETRPSTESAIREQLDRLGDTLYELGTCTARIEGGPMVPKSLLNRMRRELVEKLDAIDLRPGRRISDPVVALEKLRASLVSRGDRPSPPSSPALSVLCRTTEQVRAALDAGIDEILVDYQDIKEYVHAVEATRGRARLFIATPRIQKPGEANIFRYLAKQGAEGILVRNPGGLFYCADHAIPFLVDFSMNCANELTLAYLLEQGAIRVAASYDLAFQQLDDLLAKAPAERIEVVVHQQIPMFHMEHCVFCAFLSPGNDKTNCGRPCDDHRVELRDRVGMEHPLTADVGCRNTLFNAVPQSAAEYLPRLVAHGVGRLRIEFLRDDAASVARVIALYRDALEGRRDAKNLWRELKATNQYGVTRGQLAVLQ
ncbi:MAG: DUF3656 domain-containing protein [Isosphaeraceae bacterium]|nr:DUF3656 domain-containing protein [Isosphaeraceae bacterium]